MVQILGKDVGHTGFGMMGTNTYHSPAPQLSTGCPTLTLRLTPSCPGLTWRTTIADDKQAFSVLDAAISNNTTFWNGGELYGTPEHNSLHLCNRYFTANPRHAEKVLLSIKGGGGSQPMTIDGSRTNIRRSIDECLRILDGRKKLDIFEAARVDPKVPLEETINAIAEYVKEGKVGGIGLSEVDAATIRRAHSIHPIAAVEVELSLQSPDILTNGVATTCGELGIPIIAYSPLGRGLLTGNIATSNDIDKDDRRLHLPRFAPEVLEGNARMGAELKKIAEEKGCTAAQVAIAWARGWSGREGVGEVLPIPGATRAERVVENSKMVELSEGEWE
ncbi:MAG: hypothetical protein Q9218_007031, partial [Villophora microphyllina]